MFDMKSRITVENYSTKLVYVENGFEWFGIMQSIWGSVYLLYESMSFNNKFKASSELQL